MKFLITVSLSLLAINLIFAAQDNINLAYQAAKDKEYAKAIMLLQQQIAADSSLTELYVRVADFYKYNKAIAAGKSYFQDAIKQNPSQPNNYIALALLFNYDGDSAQCFEISKQLLLKGSLSNDLLQLFVTSGLAAKKTTDLQNVLGKLKKSPSQEHFYDLGYAIWRTEIRNYQNAQKTIMDFIIGNNDNALAYKISGDINFEQKDYRNSISPYRKAISLHKNTGNKLTIDLYSRLGVCYFETDKADSGQYYFDKAISLANDIWAVAELITSYNKLMTYYKNHADFENVVTLCNRGLDLFSDYLDDAVLFNYYYDLANAYSNVQDIEHALEIFKQVLNTAESKNDTQKQILVNFAIGEIYFKSGDYVQAFTYLQKCTEDNAEKTGLDNLAAESRFYEAQILAANGDRENAKKNYDKVIRYAQKMQEFELTEKCFLKLAQLYFSPPTDTRSTKYYINMADALARQTFQLRFTSNHRWIQGKISLAEGDIETAETYYMQAIQIGHESGSYISVLAGESGLIKTYLRAGFKELASASADSAMSYLNEYYSYCVDEYSYEYFDLKNDLILPALMAFSSEGDLTKIYQTIEIYKAITHHAEISPVHSKLNNQNVVTLIRKLNALRQQIEEKWHELWQISTDQEDYLDQAIKTKSEIKAMHQEEKEYLKQLKKKYPDYYSLYKPEGKSLRDLQSDLKQLNSTFIHYFIGADATFVVVVGSNSIYCKRININRTYLENFIIEINSLFNPKDTNFTFLNEPVSQQFRLDVAAQIYKLLFEPIEIWLPQNGSLIISKDDILNRVPLEMLVTNPDDLIDDDDYTKANYLIDKYPIIYIPYANFINSSKRTVRNPQIRMAVFAPIEAEIKNLTEVFNSDEILVFSNNTRADKQMFEKECAQYQFLHIALPGIIKEGASLFSKTYFSPEKDDYILWYEFFNLKLKANIISFTNNQLQLSEYSSNGMNGYVHSLNFAGVPSVLTNLWTLPGDEYGKLMSYFYTNLKLGYNKAESLQAAKVEFRKKTNANPFFWSGLVLYGSLEPVDFTTEQTSLIVYITIAGILVLVVILIKQVRKIILSKG